MINRRSFLQLTAISTTGILLPVIEATAKQIESKAVASKNTVIIKLVTSVGDLYYKISVVVSVEENCSVVYAVKNLVITAHTSFYVTDILALSPIGHLWLSLLSEESLRISAGNTLTILFNTKGIIRAC